MTETRKKVTLRYPHHVFRPEDLLDFVELKPFTRGWKKLGLDDDADLFALQIMIMANPKGAPVIEGTGGLRKMRFSSDRWPIGKRGATQVCYAYFEQFATVLLVHVYSHAEKDNLTSVEKRQIKGQLESIERYLSTRKYQ